MIGFTLALRDSEPWRTFSVVAWSEENLHGCGAQGVQKSYCRACAVEVSKENMAQVALIGHSKPKTSKVKAHISKTLSDHAVANSWWSPSSLPAWLNQEFYVQKIQPQLKTVKVREIAPCKSLSPRPP
jgi:hypothetical protein